MVDIQTTLVKLFKAWCKLAPILSSHLHSYRNTDIQRILIAGTYQQLIILCRILWVVFRPEVNNHFAKLLIYCELNSTMRNLLKQHKHL